MPKPATPSLIDRPLRLGISSCLLGEQVRYDGGHKRDHYITDTLGRFFEFVSVCPEVAIGLGVPRPPIRLEGDPGAPRAVGVEDRSLDVTDKLNAYGRRMGRGLTDISGYILKSRSPSCGMARVPVYGGHGRSRPGSGIYARALMTMLPLLPVEEEDRLGDPLIRENFIERVFAYGRWQRLMSPRASAARLVDFHSRHKLTLMAHGAAYYQSLGRLVATAGKTNIGALADRYMREFMQALQRPATPKRHSNVLMHLMGYLKKEIDAADKTELLEVIDAYRLGQAPRIVPITLLQHHFRRHPHPYVERQAYLYPHPAEGLLRSQI